MAATSDVLINSFDSAVNILAVLFQLVSQNWCTDSDSFSSWCESRSQNDARHGNPSLRGSKGGVTAGFDLVARGPKPEQLHEG